MQKRLNGADLHNVSQTCKNTKGRLMHEGIE